MKAERAAGLTSFVASLFKRRCPPAVAWFIITIVVDSVNRVCRAGFFAHVFIKMQKGMPAFTYLDSTSTVPSITSVVGVMASLQHLAPGFVYSSFRHSVNSIRSTNARVVLALTSVAAKLWYHIFSLGGGAVKILTTKYACIKSTRKQGFTMTFCRAEISSLQALCLPINLFTTSFTVDHFSVAVRFASEGISALRRACFAFAKFSIGCLNFMRCAAVVAFFPKTFCHNSIIGEYAGQCNA